MRTCPILTHRVLPCLLMPPPRTLGLNCHSFHAPASASRPHYSDSCILHIQHAYPHCELLQTHPANSCVQAPRMSRTQLRMRSAGYVCRRSQGAMQCTRLQIFRPHLSSHFIERASPQSRSCSFPRPRQSGWEVDQSGPVQMMLSQDLAEAGVAVETDATLPVG